MRTHHTKTKGDLGVFKAKTTLCEMGYLVLSPESEHSPFDIVAYKNNTFKRIQVKYRSANNGKIDVCFRQSWADKNGTHITHVDKNEIDLYCIFVPELDKCLFFDPKLYNKAITIRIEDPKNLQKTKINSYKDFITF